MLKMINSSMVTLITGIIDIIQSYERFRDTTTKNFYEIYDKIR